MSGIMKNESRRLVLDILEALVYFHAKKEQPTTAQIIAKMEELTGKKQNPKAVYYHLLKLKEAGILSRKKGAYFFGDGSNKKLSEIMELCEAAEDKAIAEEESIKNSEQRIQNLEILAKKTREVMENEKNLIEPLIKESREQTEKIKKIQDTVVSKIQSKEKMLRGVKKASETFRSFFNKKLGVLSLIEKVNRDRNELENELIELIKKAKSFQLASKSSDVGAQIADLEKKFDDVDKKKEVFEGEVKELGSFFK